MGLQMIETDWMSDVLRDMATFAEENTLPKTYNALIKDNGYCCCWISRKQLPRSKKCRQCHSNVKACQSQVCTALGSAFSKPVPAPKLRFRRQGAYFGEIRLWLGAICGQLLIHATRLLKCKNEGIAYIQQWGICDWIWNWLISKIRLVEVKILQ